MLDEALPYDEPHGWMTPVAHALGALLLEQGAVAEAEEVYRQDLRRWPENLWALHGLKRCLEHTTSEQQCGGCSSEAAAADTEGEGAAELASVKARLAEASSRADISLTSSCYCAGLLPNRDEK